MTANSLSRLLVVSLVLSASTSTTSALGFASNGAGAINSFEEYSGLTAYPSPFPVSPGVVDIATSFGLDVSFAPQYVLWTSTGQSTVQAYDAGTGQSLPAYSMVLGNYSHSIAVLGGWYSGIPAPGLHGQMWGSDGSGTAQAFDLETHAPVGAPLNLGSFSKSIAVGSTSRYVPGVNQLALWGSDGLGSVQAFDLGSGATIGSPIAMGDYSLNIAFDENLFLWGGNGSKIARLNSALDAPVVTADLGAFGDTFDFPRYYLPEPTPLALLGVAWVVKRLRRRQN